MRASRVILLYFKLLLTDKSDFGAAFCGAASREEKVSSEQVSRPRAGSQGGTLWLSRPIV